MTKARLQSIAVSGECIDDPEFASPVVVPSKRNSAYFIASDGDAFFEKTADKAEELARLDSEAGSQVADGSEAGADVDAVVGDDDAVADADVDADASANADVSAEAQGGADGDEDDSWRGGRNSYFIGGDGDVTYGE